MNLAELFEYFEDEKKAALFHAFIYLCTLCFVKISVKNVLLKNLTFSPYQKEDVSCILLDNPNAIRFKPVRLKYFV